MNAPTESLQRAAWPQAAFVLGLAMTSAASAEEPVVQFPLSWVALAIDSATLEPPREPKPDLSQEIEARKSYAIPAAEIVGFDLLLNLYDRHRYGAEFHSTLASIRRNLHSSWDVDRDPFTVNQLGHPYQGAMYHGFARASGLNYWEGLAYTFLGSAFWEIAGETSPRRGTTRSRPGLAARSSARRFSGWRTSRSSMRTCQDSGASSGARSSLRR